MLAVTPASSNNNTSGNNPEIITYTNNSLSNILNEDNTISNNFNNLKTITDTKNSLSNILNADDTTIILILLLLTWWWRAIYSKIKNLENKNLKLENIAKKQELEIQYLLMELIKNGDIRKLHAYINWELSRHFDNAIKNWNAVELLKIILDNEWLNDNPDIQNKLILKILWLDTKDITIKFLNKNLEISWNKSTERPEYYTNFEELINTLFNAQINRIKITRKHDFNYEIDITEQENLETKIREIKLIDNLGEIKKNELSEALNNIIEAKSCLEEYIESILNDFSDENIKNFLNKELNLINKVNIIISNYFDKHPFDSKI